MSDQSSSDKKISFEDSEQKKTRVDEENVLDLRGKPSETEDVVESDEWESQEVHDDDVVSDHEGSVDDSQPRLMDHDESIVDEEENFLEDEQFLEDDDYHVPLNSQMLDRSEDEESKTLDDRKLKPVSSSISEGGTGLDSKKLGIIAGIVVSVLLVIGLIFALMLRGGGDDDDALSDAIEEELSGYGSEVLEVWDSHVEISRQMGDLAADVDDKAEFPAILIFMEPELEAVGESLSLMETLIAPEDYDKSHQYLLSFLETYEEYLELYVEIVKAESYAEDDFEIDKIDDLKSLAKQAETLSGRFRDTTDFIKSDIDKRVFGSLLNNTLAVVNEQVEDLAQQKEQEEEQKAKEEEEAQQKEADLKMAQEKANTFLNAYLSGNEGGAASLLSPGLLYNTDVGDGTSQGIVIDYSIESVEEAAGYQTYTVLVRITYEYEEVISGAVESRTDSQVEDVTVVKVSDSDWRIKYVSFLAL